LAYGALSVELIPINIPYIFCLVDVHFSYQNVNKVKVDKKIKLFLIDRKIIITTNTDALKIAPKLPASLAVFFDTDTLYSH